MLHCVLPHGLLALWGHRFNKDENPPLSLAQDS